MKEKGQRRRNALLVKPTTRPLGSRARYDPPVQPLHVVSALFWSSCGLEVAASA